MLFSILIGIGIVIAVVIFLCCIYRVADVDKALIITGGKEPVIKVSGGSFVIPIFRKASYFDLCMLTVPTDGDEIKTKTSVPIIVDWTAQIRPNTKDLNVLKKAIVSFKERGQRGIIEDVKLTLMGSVRSVVASMTPEQVQNDKETFKEAIVESVSDELADMGLELVSLNIQDITDNYGYYDDIAAIDREEKRKEAEKVKATANQQIRQQNAESEKVAKQSELDTELQIAEKAKDNALKKAEFKTETDKANADAAVAGKLQETIRLQEVAEQEGKVEVVRQEQANLAALKQKEVIKTVAEAEKVRAEIKAQEDAQVAIIDAEAKAKVTEQEAKIAEINADAKAKVVEKEAIGKAAAIEREATANANKIKLEGETEADIIAKKGTAEAEAEKAILLAKAEGEKALAEARAGNGKVNFEIEKIKIENDARIQIATNMATVMAEIGKNAEFVNIGGSGTGSNGNVLIDTLTQIPSLMKVLNAENNALNGQSINNEVNGLVKSVAEPIKGMLSSNVTINEG
jgi:flotillin